jgi:hypothetical protein
MNGKFQMSLTTLFVNKSEIRHNYNPTKKCQTEDWAREPDFFNGI